MVKSTHFKQVCVTGLGQIGLPTACLLATSGFIVHGVDCDDQVIARIQSTQIMSPEPNLENLLKKALSTDHLKVSKCPIAAPIHIIAVPTRLDAANKPDVSHVHSAIKAIQPLLRKNDLVIIESTIPIGLTKAIANDLRKTCPGVLVAYCPERVLPGQILHELIVNNRVVGGVDDASTMEAAKFYRFFVQGEILTTDSNTAEAVKLAENTFRDVNIAFANELSMIADQLDIDVTQVIRLANKHPRVNILNPSPGVGGHCIPISPWYLSFAAEEHSQLIRMARDSNTKKTQWVIRKIKNSAKKNNAKVIACLGLTYKSDVADIKGSPALAISNALEQDLMVLRVDPYVPNTEDLNDAIARADIVVFLVAHQAFLNIPSDSLKNKIVLDFAGIPK